MELWSLKYFATYLCSNTVFWHTGTSFKFITVSILGIIGVCDSGGLLVHHIYGDDIIFDS
jgi:hypothetical protein